MSRWYSSPCDNASASARAYGEQNYMALMETGSNAQNKLVSWSRIALNDEGSNVPVVTACVDHDLAVAS